MNLGDNPSTTAEGMRSLSPTPVCYLIGKGGAWAEVFL